MAAATAARRLVLLTLTLSLTTAFQPRPRALTSTRRWSSEGPESNDAKFDYARQIIEQHQRAVKKRELKERAEDLWVAGTMRQAETVIGEANEEEEEEETTAMADAPEPTPAAVTEEDEDDDDDAAPAPAAPAPPKFAPSLMMWPKPSGDDTGPTVATAAAAVAAEEGEDEEEEEPSMPAAPANTLDDFLEDCGGLGPQRFVVIGEGAILEAAGEFAHLRRSSTPRGELITFSAAPAQAGLLSFELHIKPAEVKNIEMVEKVLGGGGEKLLILRFRGEAPDGGDGPGTALLSAIMKVGGEDASAPEHVEQWYAMRDTYGDGLMLTQPTPATK
eukprot:CAMPEP_0118862876 /NCGR_PEP_ID=MMETSP1163-20130328/7946_1 /TAXON_ID=124430 /ORGANISM="Phaeomonas parva, Strain CCMP2877" /LENGTH=331 /DNA_ID=CAMNT_0006796827 /DNA_START=36 /DNA_END=1031 /DNA_ORIENTATION=-